MRSQESRSLAGPLPDTPTITQRTLIRCEEVWNTDLLEPYVVQGTGVGETLTAGVPVYDRASTQNIGRRGIHRQIPSRTGSTHFSKGHLIMSRGATNRTSPSIAREPRLRDLARLLSGLAKLHKDPVLGNASLSRVLEQLADTLRVAGTLPMQEFVDRIGPILEKQESRRKRASSRLNPGFENVTSMSLNEVDGLLMHTSLTRPEMIELGHRRFSISKSELERKNKAAIIETVQTAADNERALHIIAREAERAGASRRS